MAYKLASKTTLLTSISQFHLDKCENIDRISGEKDSPDKAEPQGFPWGSGGGHDWD